MTSFGLHTSGVTAGRFAALLLSALLGGALWLPVAVQAQETPGDTSASPDPSGTRRVEITAPSDSLVQTTTSGGERVQKLIGNVQLRQGTTYLNADRAIRFRGRGEILFTGDVLIIDAGDSLWADRVRYDSREKVGRATGQVRVSDGEVLLAGPVGRYFFQDKRAVFPEKVTLVDSARVLKSRGGEYFSEDKRAEFYRRVRVFSDSTYLEADSVTYHRRTEVSEARGHVFIERRGDRASEQEEAGEESGDRRPMARADTRRPGSAQAAERRRRPSLLGRPLPVDTTRRALLPDTTARTLLWGNRAYNEPRSGYSRVTGGALLVRLQPPDSTERRSDSTERASPPAASPRPDTLVVRARQLETTRTDTLHRLTATDSVRLWQKDLQVVSDSAVYDQFPAADSAAEGGRARRRVSRFFGTPLAWSADAQLSGDSLRVTGRRGAVRRLYARGNAFLAQEDTVLSRLQQLKGRRMTGRFATNDSTGETEMRSLTAGPNAEAIYFQKKEDGTLGGAVRVSSDSIHFRIRGGELRKMRVLSGVEGTRYEAKDVPDPFELDGLAWAPERRPQKATFLKKERVRQRLPRPRPPDKEERPAEPPPATASSTSDS